MTCARGPPLAPLAQHGSLTELKIITFHTPWKPEPLTEEMENFVYNSHVQYPIPEGQIYYNNGPWDKWGCGWYSDDFDDSGDVFYDSDDSYPQVLNCDSDGTVHYMTRGYLSDQDHDTPCREGGEFGVLFRQGLSGLPALKCYCFDCSEGWPGPTFYGTVAALGHLAFLPSNVQHVTLLAASVLQSPQKMPATITSASAMMCFLSARLRSRPPCT